MYNMYRGPPQSASAFFRGEGSKMDGKIMTDGHTKVLTWQGGVSKIAKK